MKSHERQFSEKGGSFGLTGIGSSFAITHRHREGAYMAIWSWNWILKRHWIVIGTRSRIVRVYSPSWYCRVVSYDPDLKIKKRKERKIEKRGSEGSSVKFWGKVQRILFLGKEESDAIASQFLISRKNRIRFVENDCIWSLLNSDSNIDCMHDEIRSSKQREAWGSPSRDALSL